MISVCIATYNGEKFISQQLVSILSQLADNDEIIISDDGSKDNTINIINSFKDNRITLVVNSGNHGYTPNFMNALKNAKGDYIFLSDQDDVWLPNKVDICVEYLKTNDAVFHDAFVVDSNNNIIQDSLTYTRPSYSSLIGNLYKMGHLGCCTAFRRKIIDYAIPFPSNYDLCSHDDWLVEMSCAFGKVANIKDKLIYYRRHGNNTSVLHSNINFYSKISYRLYIIASLLRRFIQIKL